MKKGEITSSQIVLVALAILGAVIIGLIYWQFFSSEIIDSETCHQSVVARATLPDFGIPLSGANLNDLVSLKCKTQKICFGSNCDNNFGNTKYSKIKVNNLNDVQRTIARSYLECWDMMGQGKLSVGAYGSARSFGVGELHSTCVVCSRFAFDSNSLKEINLDRMDLQKYMMTHAAPNKQVSYIEYITGEGPSEISINDEGFEKGIGELLNKDELTPSSSDESVVGISQQIDHELAIVYVEIVSPTHGGVLANDLKLLLGVTVVGFQIPFGKNVLGAVARSPYTWVALALGLGYQQVSTYQNRMVSAGKCGDVKFGGAEKDGCTVVRVIPYDVEYLNQFCDKFENIS